MRRMNITVFDEFLTNVNGNANRVFTSQELNSRLGQFDQLGIFVVADQVSASAILSIQIEHSGDGRNWVTKNANAEITAGTNNIIISVTTPLWGSDAGTNPSLAFVRLGIWFNANMSAHLRIHVVGRDMGG